MLIDYPSIHTKFRRACQILKLNEQPLLKFEKSRYSSRYEEFDNEITINLNEINKLKTTVLPFIKITLLNDIDIIMFAIYHELSHCFQYQKFSKWFLNYLGEWQEFGNNINRKIQLQLKILKSIEN